MTNSESDSRGSNPTSWGHLLDGARAIVTGGAQGIGRGTVEQLVALGAKVCVADLDRELTEAVAQANPDSTVPFAADLLDPGIPDELVAYAVKELGGLDIVVNNAGYSWDALVRKMSDEQFRAMLDIHLMVPFQICRAAAPHLCGREAGDRVGKVVMASSLAATFCHPGAANYSAAKAGQNALMRTLATEWGPHRVNVNSVAFGAIRTRLMNIKSPNNTIMVGGRTHELGVPKRALAALGIEQGNGDGPITMPSTAIGRPGTVEEAANAVAWMCSPLSDYITGQVIVVSGGARGGMT